MKSIQIILVIAFGMTACKTSKDSNQPSPRFSTVEEAQAHLLRFKECKACDLHQAELANADLSGADLSGADLRGCDLTHANLSGANRKWLGNHIS